MNYQLNVRVKITKFLEEHLRINLHELGLSKGFLDNTQKAQVT